MVTADLTARLHEEDGTWRLELDGQAIDLAEVPRTDREDPDLRRLLATRVAEWSLLDRGWKPAGGWTWDEGVATAGLVDVDQSPEPPPSSVQLGAEVADVLDLVDETVSRLSARDVEARLRLTLAGITEIPRYGIRVESENGAHVRFRLYAATGGAHLGLCGGPLTMRVEEFRAFRVILGPFLVDRPDPY